MNETMWYNIMSNWSLRHKGMGSEAQVSRHESRGKSLL